MGPTCGMMDHTTPNILHGYDESATDLSRCVKRVVSWIPNNTNIYSMGWKLHYQR